jgi:YNFM family putative membrane transporter
MDMPSVASLAHTPQVRVSASREPEGTLRPYSQVFAAFLCGAFAFLDLYCTQPLLPLLSRLFHASEASVSLTISASTLGVAFSAILLAIFAERVNRKQMIVASMTALALCTVLTATVTSLTALAIWRLLQGLVTPGIFIITIAYITEEWPAHLVPRVMSFYVAGTVFGGFIGRISGGLLAERFGWRSVFLFLGLAGFLGAATTLRLLRPAKPRASRPRRQSLLAPIFSNLRSPRLLATFGIGFCMLFTLVSVFSYITFYLAAPPFRLSTAALSWLFAVYLFGLVATLIAGTVLVRIGLRRGMLLSVLFCISGVVLTLIPSVAAVGFGLAIASSGVFISQTCANSFLRDASSSTSRVSAAGMYICSYYIGGTVGGILPGLLWRFYGWPGCAALTCTLLVIAGFLAFFGWRPRLVPEPVPL